MKGSAPDFFGKVQEDPAGKFETAIAVVIDGAKPSFSRPAKVVDNEVWCVTPVPKAAAVCFLGSEPHGRNRSDIYCGEGPGEKL